MIGFLLKEGNKVVDFFGWFCY